MKLRLTIAVALVALVVFLSMGSSSGAGGAKVPAGFFGVAPQTPLTIEDVRYMKAGGMETVRLPMFWSEIQPTAESPYNWTNVDQAIATAASAGLRVLPSVGTTPRWLSRKPTTLPVNNARQRTAWTSFLKAAVLRYGPGGEFWRAQTNGVVYQTGARPQPIREWQIWNEPNFFYFAYPVSPNLYAKLVDISSKAIKAVRPSAKVILAGLFAKPNARGVRGMPAEIFLKQLYKKPGLKHRFDGVSLHPYAIDTRELEEFVEGFHEVTTENHDRVGLYVSEMGWGSEPNFNEVAFEQGIRGQVRQLRGAYGYLIENQRRLNLKQVHWFSWKDVQGDCNFCDSVGLFREGPGFRPKPSWHAFVAITGGRPRP